MDKVSYSDSRVWVEIDLDALASNYRQIVKRVKPAEVLAVVKANAYGMGVEPYVETLAAAGCRSFGVAEPREAKQVLEVLARNRIKGSSVQILSSVLPDEVSEAVQLGATLPIIDLREAEQISAEAVRQKRRVKVHFKLDTGMGRLGIVAEEALGIIRQVAKLPGLDIDGVFSHFPVASDPADPFTGQQIAVFKSIVAAAEREGIKFRKLHIAASDAINYFPVAAKPPFNTVRAGLDLHGVFDAPLMSSLKLKPVVALKAKIAQVRELPAGTTLGYGRLWCLKTRARIATVAAGYADGFPLALTNRARAFVGGKICPVVGRISMDYTTVDVSAVPKAQTGDVVVFFGAFGKRSIGPSDWAKLKGTHPYDILCSLGPRVIRVYNKGNTQTRKDK